jgi:SNF2 family DNA or RNA helicase
MWNRELPSWKPRSYQEQAVGLGVSQACLGLLLPPGMGKTTITYAILQILKSKNLIKRTIVIAPLRVVYNVWPKQKDAWQEFTGLRVNILHGKDKEKNLLDLSADIYCINPEGLKWLCATPERIAFLKANFDVLVVDESTKFKHTGTDRFKLLRQFIKYFRRRYILTGTITPNGLMDLFGQMFILDEGASLGRYVTQFKNKYFYPIDHLGYTLAPHSWAREEIAQKVAPLTLVLNRAEHLDMPELLFNDILVTLPPAAMVTYSAMENSMMAVLADDAIVAANAAVATSKCRQIANGGIYTNAQDGTYENVHDVKLDALEDLLEQLGGEPLLVVYEFGFDIEKILARFPKALRLTTGSPKKDSDCIARFAAGLVTLGAGQFSSIALGIDGLQNSCRHVCMYGLTWNLQDYIQTIDRVYRQGQKSDTVTIHRIIAKDTLDEKVLRVLDAKDRTQTGFLNVLKGLRS